MLQNYAGVDPEFERLIGKGWYRHFMRWVGLPLYYGFLNEGYGMRLGHDLIGLVYLQHRPLVTHINDIEINLPFQGRGFSRKLLAFAEEVAQRRGKPFLTLAVTISNQRAVKLYLSSGFVPQHHHDYLLTRTVWSESPNPPLIPAGQRRLTLQPLSGKQAERNLQRFFSIETRAATPEFAPVWEAYYRPTPPSGGRGTSYGVKWDEADRDFSGHVDFFQWHGRGRWRVYLPPEYWDTPQEKALFELFLNESRFCSAVAIALGSSQHHARVGEKLRHLGFNERTTERMLMIKPVSSR
jgi:GNAT superfamily N-acetyltransferase